MTGHFNWGLSLSVLTAKCFPENFRKSLLTLRNVMKLFLKTLSGGHDQQMSCA
jgi:hypothetical protein